MVKMTYVGPGVKPNDMNVEEHEVDALEKTGHWKKATSKKKDADTKEEGK